MLLNNIICLSFTLAFLFSLPTWSMEEGNQLAKNSQPRSMAEYFDEHRRLTDIIFSKDATLEEIRLAGERKDSLVFPREVRSPTVDVDERVRELQERIDNELKPMREQANTFVQLTTPWSQTLGYHLENGSLTQEVIDQIKADAKAKGYTLAIPDFEKIVQSQESESRALQLAQDNFRSTLEARFVGHYKNGTLTQQVIDALREEAKSLGVPLVLEGLPDGLH